MRKIKDLKKQNAGIRIMSKFVIHLEKLVSAMMKRTAVADIRQMCAINENFDLVIRTTNVFPASHKRTYQ